jgi:hypothetical protein
MRMHSKKPVRAKKPTPRSKKSTRFTGIGAQTTFLVVIGVVVAVAMVIGTQSTTQPSKVAAGDVPLDKMAAAHARAPKPVASTTAPLPDTMSSADAASTKMPDPEPAPKALEPKASPVTITGCLEAGHDTFRLRDTSGADAPKSRSWKSGFLKKGSAPIEVVDPANRLQLPNHVGQRVSVTGMLVDREMRVRSLKRVAASCNVQVAKL